MLSIYFCLHLLTFVIPYIHAEARTYYYADMCTTGKRINNCSSQISSPHENSCLIYNTDACRKKEFRPWILEPLFKPSLESNAEFTVVIEPYAFYIDDVHKNAPVSAINISVTSFNKIISGFSIIMNRNSPPKNVCRVVDFWNSMDNIKIPFTFFYDCFHKLREDFWKDVLISFTAYPLNIELTYQVYIPRVSGKNSNSSCDWTPLLMIYHDALSRNHIQLKFTNPQNDSSILFFVVSLLDSSDVEIDKTRIPSNVKNDMIFSEFQSVKGGYYSISITLILPQKSCPVFKSELFLVGAELRNYSFEIFIVLLVIMVASVCGLTYYLCQRYLTSVTSVLKPSILLVYFHKQLQHEFLVMWAEYLEKHHGVNAYTLYKCGGNPKKWLDDITSKSNVIVFVVSEGLAQVFDEENSTYEEDHYWVEQLPEAKALINSLKIGEKMFCKICFPFSGKQYVPKCLKQKGPIFRLLGKVDETEDFLCYIFNCSSKFRLLNKLCCIKHHVIKNPDSMQKDLISLRDKLKNVKDNKYDTVSGAVVNGQNLQNILIEQPSLTSQNDQKLDNGIDANLDDLTTDTSSKTGKIFPQNMCENISGIFDEDGMIKLSGSSIENNGNKNVQFHEQGENVSYLNNEFLRYCLRKAVNFET